MKKTLENILAIIITLIIIGSVITYLFGIAFLIFICITAVGTIVLWKIYEDYLPPLLYLTIMVAGGAIYYILGLVALIISIIFSILLGYFFYKYYSSKGYTQVTIKSPTKELHIEKNEEKNCHTCGKNLTDGEYQYSMRKFNAPLCVKHQRELKATPQARQLYEYLKRLGIECELEKSDGYKCVDISIKEAKLNVEVDGRHHITNPKQLYTDSKRAEYSQQKGWYTHRVRNYDIKKDLDKVANAIAILVAKRKKEK